MKSTLLVVLLFSVSIVSAQTDSLPVRKGYIGMAIGPAMALPEKRQFGTDNLKGEVKFGLTFFDFGYYFHENFGVAMKGQGSVYNFNTSNLKRHLTYTYPYKYHFDSEEWLHGEFLIGVRIARPKTKSTLSLGMFLGTMVAETPEFSLATDSIETSYIKKHGACKAFAVAIDVRYNFHIGKYFDVIAGIEYLGSHPQYDLKLDAHKLNELPNDEIFKQDVNMLNVNLGVAYRLR